MTFHEKTAYQFDQKAIDAWVKYSKTENPADKANAEWFDRAAAKAWAQVPATEQAQPVATKPVRTPDDQARVDALKAFFKTAKASGLNTEKADEMRESLAKYLGCMVASRRDLSAGQWCEAIAGVEFGLIKWA